MLGDVFLPMPRCLRVAAWGTAALSGKVPLVRVPEGATLNADLLRWRDAGVRALVGILPVAGDPVGLSDAGVIAEAMEAGGAVVVAASGLRLVEPSEHTILIPTRTLTGDRTWARHTSSWRPHGFEDLGQHRRALAEALLSIGDAMRLLDVPNWPSDRADALADLQEARLADDALPPTVPPAAWDMLETSLRLRGVCELALADDGGAFHSTDADRRRALLRRLDEVARRAAMASANAQALAPR